MFAADAELLIDLRGRGMSKCFKFYLFVFLLADEVEGI